MADQMTLDSILDENPTPPPVEPKLDTPPPVETPEAKKEQYTTKKKEWRDKEQEAQGRGRDPDTGQYSTKEVKAPVEAPKEEVKDETKVEVKPPVEEYS